MRRVWSRNLKNEEAMARIVPQRHRKQTKQNTVINLCNKNQKTALFYIKVSV